jgi:hypothetical protein
MRISPIIGTRSRSVFQKFSENVQIGHNADAACRTKAQHLSDVEVPGIPSAEDIGLSVRSSVPDVIVGGIGEHQP